MRCIAVQIYGINFGAEVSCHLALNQIIAVHEVVSATIRPRLHDLLFGADFFQIFLVL